MFINLILSNLVGTGSIGSVYKGSLHHIERPIAVKGFWILKHTGHQRVSWIHQKKKNQSFTAECIDMEKFKRWNLLMLLTILLKLGCKLCRIHHSYKRCWIGVTCTYPKTVFQETTVLKISCVNLKILVWIHSPLLVLCSLLLSAPIQFPHCDSNANSFCLKPFSRDSI